MSGSGLRGTRGFSLTELLIVIVIVSILAAIAVPSYQRYVIRTHRTVAKSALQEIATRQESYLVDHKRYAADFGRLGLGSGTVAYVSSEGTISGNTANALYTISLHGSNGTLNTCSDLTGTPTPTAFRLSASVFTGKPADTDCGTVCLSSTGERGSSLGTVASCWGR